MTTVRIKLSPDGESTELWLDKKPLRDVAAFIVWTDDDGSTHASFSLKNVSFDIEGDVGHIEQGVHGGTAPTFTPPPIAKQEQPAPIAKETAAGVVITLPEVTARTEGCTHLWYQAQSQYGGMIEQECGKCGAVRRVS